MINLPLPPSCSSPGPWGFDKPPRYLLGQRAHLALSAGRARLKHGDIGPHLLLKELVLDHMHLYRNAGACIRSCEIVILVWQDTAHGWGTQGAGATWGGDGGPRYRHITRTYACLYPHPPGFNALLPPPPLPCYVHVLLLDPELEVHGQQGACALFPWCLGGELQVCLQEVKSLAEEPGSPGDVGITGLHVYPELGEVELEHPTVLAGLKGQTEVIHVDKHLLPLDSSPPGDNYHSKFGNLSHYL